MSFGSGCLKNKILLVLSMMLFISTLAVFASAKDIAFIVKSAPNPEIYSLLVNSGYSYDVISENSIPMTNFSNYKILLVQDTLSTINRGFLPLTTKNSIFLDKNIIPIVWPLASTGSSAAVYSRLYSLGTPFTVGFDEIDFMAYTSTQPVYYLGVKPPSVKTVAYSTGAASFGNAIIAYSNSSGINQVYFGYPNAAYWTQDTLRIFNNSLAWIPNYKECNSSIQCGNETYSEKYCDEGNSMRNHKTYTCSIGGTCGTKNSIELIESCIYGCSAGKCLPQCRSNELSRCGSELYSDNFCVSENVTRYHVTPACSIEGTCSINNATETIQVCEFGCSNGQCVVPECIVDSDCGQQSSSTTCNENDIENISIIPSCVSNSCENNTLSTIIQTCSDACSNAECVTFNCHDNSECGTDGFIGNYFCSDGGNSSLRFFQTFSCLNPSTANSSCSNSTDLRVANICTSGCSEGVCNIIYCNPADINLDGNVNLEDFGTLKDYFGTGCNLGDIPITHNHGDLNGDGCVNLEDFGVLKDNFGNMTGPCILR